MERMVSFAVTLSIHVALGWALISTVASGTARPGAPHRASGTPLIVQLIPLERPAVTSPSVPDAGDRPEPVAQPVRVDRPDGQDGQKAAASAAPPAQPSTGAHSMAGTSVPALTELRSDEAQAWRNSVQTHLARYRLYPPGAANEGRQGTVLLRFTVKRNGQVEQAWIDSSSGIADIDRETIAAILRAQPLPAFPAGWPDTLDIRLPVSFRLG